MFLLVRLYLRYGEEDMVSLLLCCFFATNVVIDLFLPLLELFDLRLDKRNISLKISGNSSHRSSMLERRKYGTPIIIHFYICSFQGTGKILEHRPKKVLNFEKSSLYMQRSRYYTQSHLLNKISSRRLAIILLLISSLGHTTLDIFEPGVR